MEWYSATKKDEIMPVEETQMDLEIVILNEVRQRRRNITGRLFLKGNKQAPFLYV